MMNKIFIVLLFIFIGNKLYAQNDEATCVTTPLPNPNLIFGTPIIPGETNGIASDMWQQYYTYGEYSRKIISSSSNTPAPLKLVHSQKESGLPFSDTYSYAKPQTTTEQQGKAGQAVPATHYKPCLTELFNPTSNPAPNPASPATSIAGDNLFIQSYGNPFNQSIFTVPSSGFMPESGHLSVVYTSKRKFTPGFYRITIGGGNQYLKMILLYGTGTVVPNISLNDYKYKELHTRIIGTPIIYNPTSFNPFLLFPFMTSSPPSIANGTAPNGLNAGRLKFPQDNFFYKEVSTQVVYLRENVEYNFLLSVSGYLMDKDRTPQQGGKPTPNMINFTIEPLQSPEQICTEYVAKPEINFNNCNLTNLTFDVLDGNAKYLFFYRNTTGTSEPYKILPTLLVPKNKKIKALNVPYDITNNKIIEWGIIRSDDGCTFMSPTPITNIPTNRVQISSLSNPPLQLEPCDEQVGKLTLTITENAPSTNVYEVLANGYGYDAYGSYVNFLRWEINAKTITSTATTTTKELVITDIPLGYTISSFVVKGNGHPCASEPLDISSNTVTFLAPNYSFLGGEILLESLGTCGQKLIFTPTNPTIKNCDIFEWYYSPDAVNKPFTYITTGQELAVSRPGDYQVKHIVDGKFVIVDKNITVNDIIPTISLSAINITPVPNPSSINSTSTSDVLEAGDGFNADMLITENLLPTCLSVVWSITPLPPLSPSITINPITCTNGIARITANIPSNTPAGVYTLKAKVVSTVNPSCTYEVTKVIRVKPSRNEGKLFPKVATITTPLEIYGLTQTSLDESYFVNHNRDKLYFAYKGDYQSGNSGNSYQNPLKAIIYNWERKIMGTFTMPVPVPVPTPLPYNKQYGSTWYEVQLPSTISLTDKRQYILELYDENEWLRKMRFNVIPNINDCEVDNGCEQGRKYFEVKDIKSSDRPPYKVEWSCINTTTNVTYSIPVRTINTDNNRAYFNDFVPTLPVGTGATLRFHVIVRDMCNNIIHVTNCDRDLGDFPDISTCTGNRLIETPKFQLFFNVIPQATPTTPTIKH